MIRMEKEDIVCEKCNKVLACFLWGELKWVSTCIHFELECRKNRVTWKNYDCMEVNKK